MKIPFSEQEILRQEKKAALEKLGINPYPAATFHTTTTTYAILKNYVNNKKIRITIQLLFMNNVSRTNQYKLKGSKNI